MRKAWLISLALLVLPSMAHAQTICPGPIVLGCDCSNGVRNCNPITGGSVFDSAITIWTFNDLTGLGDDAVGSSDLTLVNVPTAMGGALGYAAKFDGISQYAAIADNASFNIGATGPSFVVWVNPTDLTGFQTWYTDDDHPTAGDRSWNFQTTNAAAAVDFFQTNATFQAVSVGNLVAGTRSMVAAWWDAADGKAHASLDDGVVSDSAGTLTGVQDSSGDKRIAAAYATEGSFGAGTVGPVLHYSTVVTSAQLTSLYNSGEGKPCAALTAAEQVGLVSCWDMTEDGGPYADSIGSNNLTAVNVPTLAPGLIERSDSGMSVNLVEPSEQTLTRSSQVLPTSSDFTVVHWQYANMDLVATTNFFPWKEKTSTADQHGIFMEIIRGDGFKRMYNRRGYGTFVDIGDNRGSWIMIVYEYVNATTTCRVKAVGAAANGNTWTAGSSLASSTTNYFNVGGNEAGSYMGGIIDNFAIWDRVLTEAEIDSLYAAGAGLFY